MRLKNLDLIGGVLCVALYVGWILLASQSVLIGVVLALPLIFILPGYMLTQALFRPQPLEPSHKSNSSLQLILRFGQPVSAVDHIILTIGLSLALDILVGFMLNLSPGGLQRLSWTLALGVLILVFTGGAAYRRYRHPTLGENRLSVCPRITFSDVLLFVLGIMVVIAAVWYSFLRPVNPQFSSTQFWMLPSQQAENSCAVRLGIHNMDADTAKYNITMTVNGTVMQAWSSVTLSPQEQWDQTVSLSPEVAKTMDIKATLYQADKPTTVNKQVNLTMQLSSSSAADQKPQCKMA